MRNSFFLSVLFVLLLSLRAGAQYIPLDNRYYDLLEQALREKKTAVLLSMKPVTVQELSLAMNTDSVLYALPPAFKHKFTWLSRKLYREDLLLYSNKNFSITANPLFHFNAGYETKAGHNTWTNTRGAEITGILGKQLSFYSAIYENQAKFASWPDSIIRLNGVVPGQGWAKDFKKNSFDFFSSTGYMAYSPSRFVNFTLGYGKNFIGEGYRSLLLSDVAFNYPYLRIDGNFGMVKYTALYNQFIDRRSALSSNFGYDRKWAAIHYLQVMLWKRLNLGLFDAVVWENADSSGYRGFDVQYLNPVILLRPVEESFASPDNALMGGTFSLKVNRTFSIYGQLVLDEFKLSHMLKNDGWWANKYGYQLGITGWNLLKLKGLNARAEYNRVRPYTYSHSTETESYSHFNEPLAHPLGANFHELIVSASYTRGNWMASIKGNTAVYGADTSGRDFGKNIFIPYGRHYMELDNKIGQGLKTNLYIADASLSYFLNRRTNMRIEAGLTMRQEKNTKYDKQMMLFYFGIRTGLRNLYYDF